jgi:transposase
MAKRSSEDLRATAAAFGVSVASVVKWPQRRRASGSSAATQMGGWRQLRLHREREWRWRGSPRSRIRWKAHQGRVDPKRLVFE